jgi:hypothetical protein
MGSLFSRRLDPDPANTDPDHCFYMKSKNVTWRRLFKTNFVIINLDLYPDRICIQQKAASGLGKIPGSGSSEYGSNTLLRT